MKNLKVSSQLSFDLQLQFEGETLLLSAFDVERNRVFFVSSANVFYTVQLPLFPNLSSDFEPLPLEPGDHIAAMEYLIEKEAMILGSSRGCLLIYNVDMKTTDVVGEVKGGVKSLASSPDGALLVVASGSGQLLLMTHDWDVQYETPLDPHLYDNVDINDMEGSSSTNFDSSISWRGDGRYYATINGVHNSSFLQNLRIWERESGVLHSSSELKEFMGTSLDWMPSGAKIAAAYDRKSENKCPMIVLFEKNGLERNNFSADVPVKATIKILKWNCNSDLLAASVACDEYEAIKIWSFSNNHWYLKQEIRYSNNEGVKFIWDPLKPFHLISWTLHGMIVSYNFLWTTAVSDTSVALVIDNSNVLVTPLSLSLMPPPMSLFSLKFASAVQDVSFYFKCSKNYIAAWLSNGDLCIMDLPTIDMWDQFEGSVYDIKACLDLKLERFMHLTWLDSHILVGVSSKRSDNCLAPLGNNVLAQHQKCSCGYMLQEIEVVHSENSVSKSVASSGWQAKISKVVSFEEPIIAIAPAATRKCSAFIQLQGGSIIEYSSANMTVHGQFHLHGFRSEHGFSSSCPWMKSVLVRDNGILRDLVFGLDDNGRLHLRKRILCKNCSTFSFYSAAGGVSEQVVTHLLLITKQDMLIIMSMDEVLHGNPEIKIDSYNNYNNGPNDNKDFVHIWERGAKLIGVVHGDEASVLVQTNRGSLECIYPRKLVLVSVTNALIQGRFKDAMLMVRRHRIDFNIIVDYCGLEAFLQSTKEFVCQVDNLGHITDFVSSIKNENVIDTLYKSYITLPSHVETGATEGKVSSVLLAVRKALEEQIPESSARELCILTTLARSEPPALEEALNRIKVIRELELSGIEDAKRRLYPSAEESLKHLLWLTDVEAVYEAALGLYDLNLAAIVALNSQKDPKEFLPYLRSLEELPPPVMRYSIDLRLHRYESALKHIVSAGDDHYEECMNLLKNNPQLFSLGLQLFSDHVKRSEILEAWGDHLHAAKSFEDAARIYLCCSALQKALRAYRGCADWRGVFTVAGLLRLQNNEILLLANDLCEEMQALGKPAEAASIALEYLKDVARAVDYLTMAREWEEALRIAYMQEQPDLVSPLTSACLECATALISEYNDGLEKVGKYSARYLAVRQRRILLAAKLQAEDRLASNVDYDTLSESSSTFSDMSAYTTGTKDSGASISSIKSSKDRRQRHKGGKIRPGSPGEELGLVDHLKGMSLTESVKHELKSLVATLVMLGMVEVAIKLQSAVDAYQISQKAAVKLAEDTIANDTIDEGYHTLENYIKRIRLPYMKALPPQSEALLPPLLVKTL